jgi:type 1 fimbria pilin
MKFAKIALVAAMGLTGISSAYAAGIGGSSTTDQGHGTVTFTGSIIDAPCSITPDTIDQTVDLGEVSDAALANQGSSTPVPFQIKLENCDISDASQDAVSVTFQGMQDAVDPSMLGLSGTAAGAGIVITTSAGSQLDLGTASAAQQLQTGPNTLGFTAYLRGEAAATPVTPGDFSSVANFSLAYE